MANSVPVEGLRRRVAAQLRQVTALVEATPAGSPALRLLYRTLATVIPQIPQPTNHLLGRRMAPEILERIFEDFNAVELLVVATVCSQLAEVVAGLLAKLEGAKEPGVLLKAWWDTTVWGSPITSQHHDGYNDAGLVLKSIIWMKPRIRLVVHGNLVDVDEECVADPALLCKAINSVEAATLLCFDDSLALRLFQSMACQTTLKVLRIDMGFIGFNMGYFSREHDYTWVKNAWERLTSPTVVEAVSKLELAVSKNFLPFIGFTLDVVASGATNLSEMVIIFRSQRTRKFTLDLTPNLLAEAVSKMKVFTVQKAMVTEEQVEALQQLPGMLSNVHFNNLHFHFHSTASGPCSPACTHHETVLLKNDEKPNFSSKDEPSGSESEDSTEEESDGW